MTTTGSTTAPPPATKLKEDAKPEEGEEKMKQLRELARKSLDLAEAKSAENATLKAELARYRSKEFPPKDAKEAEKPTNNPVTEDKDTFPGKEGAVKTPKDTEGTEGALTHKAAPELIADIKAQLRAELLKELQPALGETVQATLKGMTPRPGMWGAPMTQKDRWTKFKAMIQQAVTYDRKVAGGALGVSYEFKSNDAGWNVGQFGFKSPAEDPMALQSTELFVQKMLADNGVLTQEAI